MNNLIFVLLTGAPQGEQNPLMSFLPLLLIIFVFYFFMIRPQVKKQKELRNYRESLKKGDRVVTTGGIYGKIADIKDNVILVDVDENTRLKIDKSAILKDPSDIESKR